MNIFYRSPFDYRTKVISIDTISISLDNLKTLILEKEGLWYTVDLTISHNGKLLREELIGILDVFIQVNLPVLGGKGGFGSMLRAIGAQIEKTTNREACRDLSGRRLRDVNEEKRIKEWIKKQAQRKDEENKKKEKLKRIAEGGTTLPGSYDDPEYEKFRTEIPDLVEDSIICGLKQQEQKKSSETVSSEEAKKRKRESDDDDDDDDKAAGPSTSAASSSSKTEKDGDDANTESPPKKKKPKKKLAANTLWLGIEASDTSESDSEEEKE